MEKNVLKNQNKTKEMKDEKNLNYSITFFLTSNLFNEATNLDEVKCFLFLFYFIFITPDL